VQVRVGTALCLGFTGAEKSSEIGKGGQRRSLGPNPGFYHRPVTPESVNPAPLHAYSGSSRHVVEMVVYAQVSVFAQDRDQLLVRILFTCANFYKAPCMGEVTPYVRFDTVEFFALSFMASLRQLATRHH
jgi:hypothetical protein